MERIVAKCPGSHAQIVLGEKAELMNPKIANLAKPGVAARGDVVVIADSDIRVGRDYLRGAVTGLYSGNPRDNLVSRLGALGINDGLAPSVLAALGHTFADDHKLVELSRYVVTTTIPETNLRALLSHELRWARNDLELAGVGHFFSFLSYGLPPALIYLAVSRNLTVGVPLLAVIIVLRVAQHYLARRALNVTRSDDVWLIPLRDFLSLAVWATSLFGRRRSFR
ncbi:MAG TPA: glycosyltransferase [Candidatus Cybelea sp.]